MYTTRRLRKGLSELLAIVIGVAITIAIGVMFYTFMPNLINTMSQQQRIGVMLISSTALEDGGAIVTLSIKNMGMKAVKELNISLINFNIESASVGLNGALLYRSNSSIYIDLTNSALSPGQEMPVILRVKGSTDRLVVSGTRIPIIILATFADGSSTSLTTSITIL